MTPEVGWICAEQTCSNVVLPAPLGPRITQRSSSSTIQSTLSSRVAWPRFTVTDASSTTAVMGANLAGTPLFRRHRGGLRNVPSPRRLGGQF